MNRIVDLLLRLIVIIAGYVAASIAASAFLHLVFLASAGFHVDEAPWLAMGSVVFSVPFIALFVAYFAFMPAMVVLGIAEVLARRDWLTYAIGGAAVGLAVAALFWQGSLPNARDLGIAEPQPDGDPTQISPALLAMVIGGGIVGGLFYWLVAGRSAGNWLRRSSPRAEPPTSPAP